MKRLMTPAEMDRVSGCQVPGCTLLAVFRQHHSSGDVVFTCGTSHFSGFHERGHVAAAGPAGEQP